MDGIVLKAKVRETTGKGGARQSRRDGKIPGVVYGPAEEPVLVEVDGIEATRAIMHGHHAINLDIEGLSEKNNIANTLLKEVQRNYLTDQIIHIDFQKVGRDQEVEMIVPLVFINEEQVKKLGGVIQHSAYEVKIKVAMNKIPDHIEIDMQDMEIGDVTRMKDLEAPDGVEVLSHPDETIVSVVAPRGKTEAEEAEEAPSETEPELIAKQKAEEA